MNRKGRTMIDEVYVFDSLPINQGNNSNGGVSVLIIINSNPYPYRVNPAPQRSIHNLERFTIEEPSNSSSSSIPSYSICFDALSLGSEATRMPCSHVYHTYCINKCLNNSNTCPSCRTPI